MARSSSIEVRSHGIGLLLGSTRVPETTLSVPRTFGRLRVTGRRSAKRPEPVGRRAWGIVALVVVLLSVIFVTATGMRPAFDAYGWLVWGREAAHWSLDTSAAPSWKPLTFLFTFPYALLLDGAALWAWMVTAVAAALAAPVLAARIAYRLTAPHARRRYPAAAAGAFAGAGVLGIEGYGHFMLIATADPMIVALCLAAIDCALSRRRGLTWLLLVLVCLGRPEAWPLALAYVLWAWREAPERHRVLVGGLAAIPLLWFGVPALTSNSWMIAADVLSESTHSLPGNKLDAVISSLISLYELPMQIMVLLALVLAVVLRERTWLLVASAAALWVAADVVFAWHGWGIAPRYLFEPAAMLVLLAAAAVGRALALDGHRHALLRLAAIATVLVLVVTLAPHAQQRARLVHNGIVLGRTWTRQIHRLHTLIATAGGVKRILACGQPVTEVSYQSVLAWELGENVIDVGWKPRTWIRLGVPIVLFEPRGAGWQARPIHALSRRNPNPAQPPERNHRREQTRDASVVQRSLHRFSGPSHPARTSGAGARPSNRCDQLAIDTALG